MSEISVKLILIRDEDRGRIYFESFPWDTIGRLV